MADKDRTIDGSVRIIDKSPERVAFDLLSEIANHEATPKADEARDYYLKLYVQCLLATRGYNAETVLKRA